MGTKEFRIPVQTASETGLGTSIFKADSAAAILSEAKETASVYNGIYKEKTDAQNLAASAVIYKAIQTAIDFFLKDNGSYFTSAGGKDTLLFFEKEYGDFDDEAQEVRFFFVNRVLDKSPAIKKEMGLLFEKPDFKVPQKAISLLNLLKSRGGKIKGKSLFDFLVEPFEKYPLSLKDQLLFIAENWSGIIGEEICLSVKRSFSMLSDTFSPALPGGGAPTYVPDYFGDSEYENFSPDLNWMPNVVMIAKNTLVWLSQLSDKYGRDIRYLSDVPDEELDRLKRNGFNALWLIGLWERSAASKEIKNRCGNPEAEASAYSLKSYNISSSIGGWSALENLKQRCDERGIRLASDMVPNHTGLDSDWVKYRPDYFIKQKFLPFDSYTFNGPNLSRDPDLDIRIEDHYYSRSDAAVVFKRTDNRTGETDYVWHGNDGTAMPWNDTAQLDFLNPDTREAVIKQILEVARNFRIIRFDAAMTLARKHIRRLWYPNPGSVADIAGRGIFGKTDEQFNRDLPTEFWREVVDRVAREVPDTLLLAEAFWMMEGYFVRTLGMHRVYNSAFMNMLKNGENAKYRESIKKTLLFDPEILKRYVNFMNNPDEDPAVVQFGKDDRYFGVCTLLSTMPGLPMFGHGQIEGFSEKYGMEYTRAYKDEHEDPYLVSGHERRIFPLLRKRYLFSGCELFNLFDFNSGFGTEESVFAYTNGCDGQRVLVLYNNRYERCEGTVFNSAAKVCRDKQQRTFTIAQALNIGNADSSDFLCARLFNSSISLVKRIGRIKNEGLTFAIDGWQSMVFTDFRILKATDELNAIELNANRFCLVDNLENELAMHRNRPVVESTQRLLERGFKEEVSLLCDCPWRSTAVRSVSKILLTWYAEMQNYEEILNCRIKAKNCVPDIREIALLNKCPFFASAKDVEDSWKEAMAAYLLIKPFAGSDKPVEILRKATALPFAGLFSSDAIERACILLMQMPGINRPDSRPEELTTILRTPLFRKIIGQNEYRGKTYYNSERLFSTVLFILSADALDSIAAGKRLFTKRYEQTLAFWLKKVHDSEYLIDKLLD